MALADEMGASKSGSIKDIIHRISNIAPEFNKIFSKLPGHSGGWLTLSCTHGVIYYLNCIRRAEGVRDYIDAMLSLKHIPNVSIIDMAHLVASHGNSEGRRREVIRSGHADDEGLLFFPNDGRLARKGNLTSSKLL